MNFTQQSVNSRQQTFNSTQNVNKQNHISKPQIKNPPAIVDSISHSAPIKMTMFGIHKILPQFLQILQKLHQRFLKNHSFHHLKRKEKPKNLTTQKMLALIAKKVGFVLWYTKK